MAQPLVSVIMPVYNRLAHLRQAIDSVLAQTLADWELLVADDGSDAPVRAYLAELSDARIQVLPLPHSGNPSAVRNAAIRAARGHFLAFLDSDDLWTSGKLERQIAAMRARPERRWSYSSVRRIDAEGRDAPTEGVQSWRAFEGDIVEPLLRLEALLATPAVMAERELVLAAGAFDEQQRFCEDYDLWLRLALRSEVTALSEPLACVRVHTDNYSQDRTGAHLGWVRLYGKYAAIFADAGRRRICRQRYAESALALAASYQRRGEHRLAIGAFLDSAARGWLQPRWWPRAARVMARGEYVNARRASP